LFAPAICETATVAAYESAGAYEAAVTPNGSDVPATAEAETAETEPSVKAATATSAMRLKVVFVDICFLSIVDLENLPSSA
jgi:hypothetical protein